MFSVTIFRPLTFARNYATIADRKRQIREVIFAGIFRNNRARKRIRTPIFHQGSYAHRLAQRRGLSAGCALDGFVGGKGFCPFSAPCFAASARDLRGMPDFSPSPHVTQKNPRKAGFFAWRREEDTAIYYILYYKIYNKHNIWCIFYCSNILVIFHPISAMIFCLSLSYICPYVLITWSTVSPISSAITVKFAPICMSIDAKEWRKS